MDFFLQFYRTSPQGEMLPIREAFGQWYLNPDLLQWDVEQRARGICRDLGLAGFQLWERDERCKVSPMGRIVKVAP